MVIYIGALCFVIYRYAEDRPSIAGMDEGVIEAARNYRNVLKNRLNKEEVSRLQNITS